MFGEQGYERASIVDITRAAGTAQGTFYVYFESKKAVFVELVRELGHGLRSNLAQAIEGLTDRLDVEREGFRAFLSFVEKHRNMYRIIRQAEFVDEELYRDYYLRMAEGYKKGLRSAMRKGEFKKLDPEAIAYALMGIFDFIGMRWVLWEESLPSEKVMRDVFSFIAHGLAAQDP